jgi:hypothetical protein
MRFNTQYERAETTATGHKFITLQSGRKVSFYDAENKCGKFLTDLTRWGKRLVQLAPDVTDPDISEYYNDTILRHIERTEALAEHWRALLEQRVGVATKRQRIAALRDVRGRTPEEAAVYLAKADQLEEELS